MENRTSIIKYINYFNIFSHSKAWAVLLIIIPLSFLSCQSPEENTYLEYGELKWGMTSKQVLEFLEVSSEDIITQDQSEGREYYLVQNVEFCGAKTSRMALNFMDIGYPQNTTGIRGLISLYAYYPENTDMEKAKKEMEKIYGDSISEIYEYSQNPISPDLIQEDILKESETVKLWGGPKLSQVVEKELLNQYYEQWISYQPELQEEIWEKFSKNARLVTGTWVNLPSEGGKAIHFDAYNLAVYREITNAKN